MHDARRRRDDDHAVRRDADPTERGASHRRHVEVLARGGALTRRGLAGRHAQLCRVERAGQGAGEIERARGPAEHERDPRARAPSLIEGHDVAREPLGRVVELALDDRDPEAVTVTDERDVRRQRAAECVERRVGAVGVDEVARRRRDDVDELERPRQRTSRQRLGEQPHEERLAP